MRKRAYLGRPCFWPRSFVARMKLVLFSFNVSRRLGMYHIPFYASRNPAFTKHFKGSSYEIV